MVARLTLGLVVGAAFAALGIWLAPTASPAANGVDPTASTTTTTPTAVEEPPPVWIDDRETVLGPSVIIPTDLQIEGSEVVFHFELYDIAPDALGRVRSTEELNLFIPDPPPNTVVVPEFWTLITADGEIPGQTAHRNASTARFPVPDGFDLSMVNGIRIDGYRMRMPYVYELELDTNDNRPFTIDGGIEMSVARVLRQRTTSIVQLDVHVPDDEFAAAGFFPYPRIRGVGPQWRAGGPRDTGGVQMLWEGGEMPDIITVQIRSVRWIPFESSIDVDLGGLGG